MGKLSKEERPKIGALANEIREVIAGEITSKQEQLEKAEIEKNYSKKRLTLPFQADRFEQETIILSKRSLKKLKICLSAWDTQ